MFTNSLDDDLQECLDLIDKTILEEKTNKQFISKIQSNILSKVIQNNENKILEPQTRHIKQINLFLIKFTYFSSGKVLILKNKFFGIR